MAKISNFKGLITDADPADVPAGASKEQENVVTSVLGELSPRKGIQPATFSTTTQIKTGYNTFQKMCFCKTRKGEIIGVNGLNRGFIWDGVSSTALDLGIKPPTTTPTITRASITLISGVVNSGSNEYRVTTGTAHGFTTGDYVLIGNITSTGAMAGDLNGKKHKVTVTSTTQFDVDDLTFNGSYAGGGACSKDGLGTTKGDYLCAYRYVDNQSTPVYSSLTTGTKVEALTSDQLTWGALDTSPESRVDMIELWRTTAGVTNVYFKIATFAINGNITSSADDGGKIKFTVPEGHNAVVGQKMTVTGSSVAADNATHEVTAVTATTITTATSSTGGGHSGSGGSWGYNGYVDNVDDDTLNLSEGENILLVVVNPPMDNTIVARRFVPPPDDMAYCVMFQDRYFYFGIVKYDKGTIHNAGSDGKTLTGIGTDWTEEMVGRYVEVANTNKAVKITAFTSATSIDIETPLGAAIAADAGRTYIIAPEKSRRRILYYSYQDEPESVPDSNAIIVQENSGDDDDIIGAMPFGPYLYLFSQRHKYALSYSQDPIKDGSIRYLDDRGACNNNCWDYYSNEAYLMDESGCYRFSGSESTSITDTIQNLFRPGSSGDKIDFTKSSNFIVKCDRTREKVYFFVSFVGDSGSFPTRALVYNINRESFDPMKYPVQITDASSIEKDGQTRLVLSSENEKIYLTDEGSMDVVSTEISGTATSSTSTTLVDTSKTFTSAVIGAFVYITGGKGKGQYRTITSASSNTIGVAAWTTNPDTTSTYSVGAIPWRLKTGTFTFNESEEREDRELIVKFEPLDGELDMDMRFYYNNDDSPNQFEIAQHLGDGIEIEYDNREDVVVHMNKNNSALQESTGKERFNFDGMSSLMAYADHQVAVEIRGHSATYTPIIQSLEITGVED
tara:strand:+ start:5292 stop:8000 length:2709 start_codon:yes stop_codon:yes gene_type:complete